MTKVTPLKHSPIIESIKPALLILSVLPAFVAFLDKTIPIIPRMTPIIAPTPKKQQTQEQIPITHAATAFPCSAIILFIPPF